MSTTATSLDRPQLGPGNWRFTLSGLCAALIGVGLARFAYTPLLPALVAAHWFDGSGAAYLGAANLAGYLAGALAANPAANRAPKTLLLRIMMAVATASFFACAWPAGFAWFFAWRFAAGLAGGFLMVIGPPAVLARIPPARRGLASGAMFAGIGFGVVASGTLVPLLLGNGLTVTWIGLGVLSLLLTAVAWNGWPPAAPHAALAMPAAGGGPSYPRRQLWGLYAEYGLNALGVVPHMILLVDFVARGLGEGVAAGSGYWVLFGLGALVGPLAAGAIADRTGFGPALRFAFLIEAIAVALLVFDLGPIALVVSSVVVGAMIPGVVTLVLGRSRELLADRPADQNGAWSIATTSFAVMQAVGAYAMSFLFTASGGDYRLLFGLGAGTMVVAFAVDLAAGGRSTKTG